MNESKQMLRSRFEAETDVVLCLEHNDWKRYAEWLESLAIKKLNNELIKENRLLRNQIRRSMSVLEKAIIGS